MELSLVRGKYLNALENVLFREILLLVFSSKNVIFCVFNCREQASEVDIYWVRSKQCNVSAHCCFAYETLLEKQFVSVDSRIKVEIITECIIHDRKLVICERITCKVADAS